MRTMNPGSRVGPLGQMVGVLLVTAVLLAAIELGAGFFLGERTPPTPTPEMPGDTVSRTLAWLEINPVPLVRDADLLWRNEPDARKTQQVNPQPWGHDDWWTLENNHEGFRGPALLTAHDTGAYRVLCVGDSVTFGFNVDQPDAYPQQLQTLLESRYPGRHFEVVNSGVPGWTWLQGIRFLQLRGLALHPDVVIMAHGTNDQFLPAKVTDEERFHLLGGPVTRTLRSVAGRLSDTNSYRLVERLFPPPPFSPDEDSPACKKQKALIGRCPRVPLDQIAAAVTEVNRLVESAHTALLIVNLDFSETQAVVGVHRGVDGTRIPFLDAVDQVRALRRRDQNALRARFGLAPESTSPSPASPTPAQTKHLLLRVSVPDRDARYVVRGEAYLGPSFTFEEVIYDDGTHGDERGDDGVYSATIDVPAGLSGVQYVFDRNGEPELRPLPPLGSKMGNRVIAVHGDTIGPIDVFSALPYMAERIHPNREGQGVIAGLVADRLATFPSFQRFVGAPGS
jgi:lysophospholipase L1-like esterase